MPSCGIKSYAISYDISAGLRPLIIHNGTDYIQFSISADANIVGYANFSVEWCDNQNGYGHEQVSIYVAPSVPPTTPPAAGTNITGCGPTGPASSCHAIGPNYFSFPAGTTYNFSVDLSCAIGHVFSDWAVSTGLCEVLVTYGPQLTAIYSVTCASTLTQKASGMVQTKWCDMKGGYLSYSTSFDVIPVIIPTLPPPAPSGIDRCRNGPASQCQVVGASLVTVPAGESYKFKITLQCPVSYCHSEWTATFHACAIQASYSDVNPTYTINAPLGAENRGGMILTEWCDQYGGYMNWTTNFIVTGSMANVTYQQNAEVGVLAAGTTQASSASVSNGNWKQTPWVIFLFCLLGVVGLIFLLAFARLAYKRVTAKNQAVETSNISQNRRSSASVGGDSQNYPSQLSGRRDSIEP